MRALQAQIRGCAEVMLLPEAGHFVQEHGERIAERALQFFQAKDRSDNWNLTPI